VTAAASRVPAPLQEQLAVGGRLVIPLEERLGQTLYLYTKSEGGWTRERLAYVAFVKLKSCPYLLSAEVGPQRHGMVSGQGSSSLM
jgi:Protein-L-isoaspartate carboxylmethyltransferase